MRDNRGRVIFVAHHAMKEKSDDIRIDILRLTTEKLRVDNKIEFDKHIWDAFEHKLLIPELQKELNGFQSEEMFSSRYWMINVHNQISSTKRNLLENFHEDILNFLERNPKVLPKKVEFDGENFNPDVNNSSFVFSDNVNGFENNSFTFADDLEEVELQAPDIIDEDNFFKYNNYTSHKLPKNSIVELLAHLVWKNPGEQDVFYMNQINFYKNDETKTDHKKMVNGIIFNGTDYLENKYFGIEKIFNGQKYIFVFRPKMKRSGYYVQDVDNVYKLLSLTELADKFELTKQNLHKKLNAGDCDLILKGLINSLKNN